MNRPYHFGDRANFKSLIWVLVPLLLWTMLSNASGQSGGASPNARGGRFEAWPGAEPDQQAFVVPLSGQKGLSLDRRGPNTNLFLGNLPWFAQIDLASQVRHDFHPGWANSTNGPYADGFFENPLAAFGGAASGSPLHVGDRFEFGFHAGISFACQGDQDWRAWVRVRAYPKAAFESGPTNGVAPSAETWIPVPTPPSIRPNDPEWVAYVSNDFQVVSECADLKSVLRLVDSNSAADKWGLAISHGLTLSHVATSDAYVYLIEQRGLIFDPAAHEIAVDDSGFPALRSLYALEFEHRPPWRSIFIGHPHFSGEPLPAQYQGRSPGELANECLPVPEFVAAPVTNLALALDQHPEFRRHPSLDELVSNLKTGDKEDDALALVNYALNEIGLVDALAYHDDALYETNSVNCGGVNRSALGVYMEGQGSPVEICSFLIYCLRKAGIPAVYAVPGPNSARMLDFRLSQLLRMQLVGAMDHLGRESTAGSPSTNLLTNAGRDPALIAVNYPWVAAYVPDSAQGGSNRWVHIFPWLADTEVVEGLDLYECLSPGSSSDSGGVRNAWEWIDRYLHGDTNLLSLAEINTPSAIFPRYLQSRLDANHPGISSDEIGVRIRNRKNNFARWEDLPRPFSVTSAPSYWYQLASNAFDTIQAEILNGTNVCIDTGELRTADLHNRKFLIRQEKNYPGTWVLPQGTNNPTADWNLGTTQLGASSSTTATTDSAPTSTTRVRVTVTENDSDFEVRKSGGWGSQFEINASRGQQITFDVRFAPSGSNLGYRRGKVQVRWIRDGTDDTRKTYTVKGYATEGTDASLSLVLAPMRPDETGIDQGPAAYGGAANMLIRKQVRTVPLGVQDQPLSIRIRHRRHRKLDEPAAPVDSGNFLAVWEKRELLQERPLSRGDLAAICISAGRVTPRMLRAHAEDFWRMERLLDANPNGTVDPEVFHGDMAYVTGMTYYHRVARFDQWLTRLHKCQTFSRFAVGLSRLNAYRDSDGLIPVGQFALVEPSVDMFFQIAGVAANQSIRPDSGKPGLLNWENYSILSIADISAQEHRAIDTFYQRAGSVSTVKLLQMAATNNPGLITLDKLNYQLEGDRIVAGKALKDHDPQIWSEVVAALSRWRLGDYARAYITPGPLSGAPGPDGLPDYEGMGALILTRDHLSALISGNRLRSPQNGAFGSQFDPIDLQLYQAPRFSMGFVSHDGDSGYWVNQSDPFQLLPPSSISFPAAQPLSALPYAIRPASPDAIVTSEFQLSYAATIRGALEIGYQGIGPAEFLDSLGRATDTGLQSSSGSRNYGDLFGRFGKAVLDPVNTISGEFYIDEIDLTLPGPMPLQIRRNYGSQNLLANQFGYGWNMSQFPSIALGTNGALAYAAEMDGSVIAYRQQATNQQLYLPSPADNPQWSNVHGDSIGGTGNLMNSRLVRSIQPGKTNFVLFGADGGRRDFSVRSFPLGSGANRIERTRPYLDTWADHASNLYWFSYGTNVMEPDYGQLVRIKSTSGNTIGFSYDAYGRIVEARAADGRRVLYEYDEHGDLISVERPDGSEIKYDYLHASQTISNRVETYSQHLIVREGKPDGRVLLNAYDDQRRVTNQCATVGTDLVPVRNGTFIYDSDFSLTNRLPVSGKTTILDAYDRATVYRYAGGLITNVQDALGQQIFREWYDGSTNQPPGGYPRSLRRETDKRGLVTEYRYDANGNVTNHTTMGDLTGDGGSSESRTIVTSYDARNLPVATTDTSSDRKTQITYGTGKQAYLPLRVERYAGATLVGVVTNGYADVVAASNLCARGMLSFTRSWAPGAGTPSETAIAYDPRGYPTSQTLSTGTSDPEVVKTFRHNARGEMVLQTDADGRTTAFQYDPMGRPIWVEYREDGPLVGWTGTYYNLNGEVEWIDGPRYGPEDYIWRKYDGAGRPLEETHWLSRAKADGSGAGVEAPSGDALYATTFYQHDLFGNLTRVTDARGNLTAMDYDEIGQMTARRRYQGRTVGTELSSEAFAYEPGGQIAVHTNALRGVTRLSYTQTGQVAERQDPDGTTHQWRYYADGRPKKEFLPNGSYWETTYNDADRKVTRALKDAANRTLRTEHSTFDERGNALSTTIEEAGGGGVLVTTRAFDGLNRPKSVTGPAGSAHSAQQTTSWEYDASGRVTKVSNGPNQETETIADVLGRPVAVAVRQGSEVIRQTSYSYSPDHHSVTITEGTGTHATSRTVWTDNAGHTVIERFGDDTYRHSALDHGGLILWARDELGNETKFSHDGLGRLRSRTLPGGATEIFAYDAAGNLTNRVMPGGLMQTMTYDKASRLTSEMLRGGDLTTRSFAYSYHLDGNGVGLLESVSDPRGITIRHHYDACQRPTEVVTTGTRPGENVATIRHYDWRGFATNIAQISNAPDHPPTAIARSFDGYGQITAETITVGGRILSTFVQSWDGAGRRSALMPAGRGGAPAYAFDYRADGAMSSVAAGGRAYAFGYGDNGLLNSRTANGWTTTIDNRDARGRVMARTVATGGIARLRETLAWNADGTLRRYEVARAGAPIDSEARDYAYDVRQRLLSESFAGAAGIDAANAFEFDGDTGHGPGVLTRWQVDSADHWRAATVDALARVSQEESAGGSKWIEASGQARGAASVSIRMDDRPVSPVNFAGWADTNGAWNTTLRAEPGDHVLTATAMHPSGNATAVTNSAFTVMGACQVIDVGYDPAGNVISRDFADGRAQSLTWDALGRLTSVVETNGAGDGYRWNAVYDGLGRRLRTTHAPMHGGTALDDAACQVDSLFDPQVEFLEICASAWGPDDATRTEWKVYGPDLNGAYGGLQGIGGLDAVIDQASGDTTGIVNDFFGNCIAWIEPGTDSPTWNPCHLTGYGPAPGSFQKPFGTAVGLAEATAWRSRRIDPTGFFCLGARYYEPNAARFLSPDPAGHTASCSLYDYANGDPVNGMDPDGRVAKGIGGGSVLGDYYKPQNLGQGIGQFIGQVGMGFTPAGVLGDVRDFTAAWGDLQGSGLNLRTGTGVALAGIAFIPGLGDAVKDLLKPLIRNGDSAARIARNFDNWGGEFVHDAPFSRSPLDGVAFEGTLYRAPFPGTSPTVIDLFNINANHRFSAPGEGALYFSSSERLVVAEMGGDLGNRTVHSIDKRVDNLLDLTNPTTRDQIGVALDDLVRCGGDIDSRYEVTHSLGTWAREQGYSGILAPSAQADAGINIIVFSWEGR